MGVCTAVTNTEQFYRRREHRSVCYWQSLQRAEHQRVLQGIRLEAIARQWRILWAESAAANISVSCRNFVMMQLLVQYYLLRSIQRRVTANSYNGEATDNHTGVCTTVTTPNHSTDGRKHSSVCYRQSLLQAKTSACLAGSSS